MTRPARRRAAAATLAVAALVTTLSAGTGIGAASAAGPCPTPTLPQQVRQADVVFRGTVAKVRPVRGTGADRTRSYKVAADRVYKASLVTDAVVVTAHVSASPCVLATLHRGTRYIFFATEHGSKLVATKATARATSRLTAQVTRLLGNGKQAQSLTPPAAEFTKVAGADPPGLARLLAPGAAVLIVSLLGLVVVGRAARRT